VKLDPGTRGKRRLLLGAGGAAVVTAGVAAVAAVRAPELLEAFRSCPPAALVAAIAVHSLTLLCRCEAWRLSGSAVLGRPLPRLLSHAAGGTGFMAGSLQGASTAPVRAMTLRRLAPEDAPRSLPLMVAEAPVFLIEAGLVAIVLAVAVWTLPVAPVWMPPAIGVGSIAALVVLREVARRRARDGEASGLSVLTDRRRRGAMAGLLVLVTALGLARAWIILLGFGLPHGPSHVAFTFVALGVFGLLPVGPGSTPAALLAVFGAGEAGAAAAAGIAVSATSFAGVAFYAGLASAPLAILRGRRRLRPVPQQIHQQRGPAEVPGGQPVPVQGVVVLAEAVPLDGGHQGPDDPVRLLPVPEPAHRGNEEPRRVHPGRAAPAAEEVEPGPEGRLVA
jgi:hypothetical protein